jgi:hypothetical protein
MSITNTPSLEKLHRAIEIAEAIAKLNAELAAVLNPDLESPVVSAVATSSAATRQKSGGGRGRNLSSAARERIAAAQRARWAKVRGEKPAPASNSAPAAPPAEKKAGPGRPKGKLSPEARERIAAAQRLRWAKWKKTKK